MKQFYLLLLFVLGIALPSSAQDIIVMVNTKKVPCRVLEVNTTEVKYRMNDTDKVVYAVDITLITEIRFENGEVHVVETQSDFDNKYYYVSNRKKALKLELFSPMMGHTAIGYEQCLKPGRSYELTLGIVGLGKTQPELKTNGVFVKAGYKFLHTPDYFLKNMRFAHILKGQYVRPEIILGTYNTTEVNKNNTNKYNVSYGALMLNFGKQVVYDDAFLIDIYFGIGYGTTSTTKLSGAANTENFRPVGTTHGVLASRDGAIAVTGGFRIGFLLK